MDGKEKRIDITLENVGDSYNRFMELLERKGYNTEVGDDELDEDIIIEVLSGIKEDKGTH